MPAEHLNTLTMQLTDAMLKFVSTPLNNELEEKAKQLVIDLLGSALAGSVQKEVSPVRRVFTEWGGAPEATVWNYGNKLPMHAAATINGTFAHALEMDDTHRFTYCHIGASVIPTAMAVAEATHASGELFLKAVIAAYETALRVALSICPEHRLIGFHPTSTIGCIGSSMAASILLGLDAKQTVNALGLGGTQAFGFYQFQYDGASSKRFHPGKAAQNGIMAAMLAREGYTGSPEILEGRYGLCRVMSPKFDPEAVTADLLKVWHIMEIGIKPYSACRFCHAPIDAARKLRSHPAWKLENLKSLELICGGQLKDQTGGNDPKTSLNAQLSTPNAMAIALIVGRNMPVDVENHFNDPQVRKLTRNIKLTVDESLPYPSRQVILMAEMTTGEKLSFRVDLPCGEPENPISFDTFRSKLVGLCQGLLNESRIDAMIDAVNNIGKIDDMNSFISHLTV